MLLQTCRQSINQMRKLPNVFCIAAAILVQDTSTRVVPKIEAIAFPPLPRIARVQGDVRLKSGPEGITLLSGNPLLAPTAVENLKDIGQLSEAQNDVVYHFVLGGVSTSLTRTTVKRGNTISRFFLRALGRKTEKVVEQEKCT